MYIYLQNDIVDLLKVLENDIINSKNWLSIKNLFYLTDF